MSEKTQLTSGAAELLDDGHRRIARLRQWAGDTEAIALKDPQLAAQIGKDMARELRRLDQWLDTDVKEKLLRTAGNAARKEADLSATVAALALRVTELTDRIARLEAGREGAADGPLRLVKGG